MTEEKIGWDEALENTDFIVLEVDEPKEIVITNWRFERRPADSKIAAGQVEFIADTVEEDGKEVAKKFTTTSNRLKGKLKPILEKREPTEKVKLSILRVGESYQTQYSLKELK
jgi:hypothetical protein